MGGGGGGWGWGGRDHIWVVGGSVVNALVQRQGASTTPGRDRVKAILSALQSQTLTRCDSSVPVSPSCSHFSIGEC